MQSSESSFLVGSAIYPRKLFSNYSNVHCGFKVGDHILQAYKTRGRVSILGYIFRKLYELNLNLIASI
jgi:hypothetical protein